MDFASVTQTLDCIRRGEIVLVVDDEDRENEGDLTMAADWVSPESVAFMLRHGRGLVCMPCDGSRLDELAIHPMVSCNTASNETAFTVSIDHRTVRTGISAHERALTIKSVVDRDAHASDFARPGHVFPLRARDDGVLARPGHTEAAVDLTRLAGLSACAVICEGLNDDGSVARLPDLLRFADTHDVPIVSIEQLIDFRLASERVAASGG
jgi:3,4-dihydroxy 2-butanone 4-phosphate synthase/GTP cyclohydrolase II